MQIDDVRADAYTVPTDAPEADATLAWDSTTMVVVRARAGGVEGIGWTYGPPACAEIVRDTLADVVRGGYVVDVGRAFEAMVCAVRNMTRPGLAGYAISAVDIALWDLKAKVLQLPLHWLLGRVTDDVAVYGSGGFTSYDDAALGTQLQDWVDRGIGRVKIKIGEDRGTNPERDLERAAYTCSVVSEDCSLFVDANGGYGRKQAIRIGQQLADCGITWFEEPVSSDDVEGLAQVRAAVPADVAAGEYGWDVYYFRRMCAAGAVDCLQADATRCGGITGWQRAAAVAASFGLEVSGHCAPHAHLAAAMATPNVRHLEWFHDHVRIESMFFDGTADPQGGRVTPAESAPGLGLVFRAKDAEPYRVS